MKSTLSNLNTFDLQDIYAKKKKQGDSSHMYLLRIFCTNALWMFLDICMTPLSI